MGWGIWVKIALKALKIRIFRDGPHVLNYQLGENHMEIITRRMATANGQRKYYTGVACRNGHLAERYTKSGTCAACIALANGRDLGTVSLDRCAARDVIADTRNQLSRIRLLCYQVDAPVVLDSCVAVTLARFPALNAAHVAADRQAVKVDGSAGWYSVLVHDDDVRILREVAAATMKARNPSVEELRAAILGKVNASIADGVDHSKGWGRL